MVDEGLATGSQLTWIRAIDSLKYFKESMIRANNRMCACVGCSGREPLREVALAALQARCPYNIVKTLKETQDTDCNQWLAWPQHLFLHYQIPHPKYINVQKYLHNSHIIYCNLRILYSPLNFQASGKLLKYNQWQ